MITRVYEAEIDGRPALMLDCVNRKGREVTVELDRTTARELTRVLGHHPLVDKFFADGKGQQ